jgi:hypothetical protein
LEQALADLEAKRSRWAKPTPEESASSTSSESSDETTANDELPESTSEATKQEESTEAALEDTAEELTFDPEEEERQTYEPLQSRELEPVEFSGGEVIIRLQGDAPVVERVVPLAEQAENEEPLAETTQAEQGDTSGEAEPAPASTAEEPAAASATGGGGEVPPVDPPGATGSSPEMPESSEPTPEATPTIIMSPDAQARADYEYNNSFAAAATEHTAPGVTKEELNDAVYRATKQGQNRGVLAGLVAGGTYEHFKHKRREKRMERRFAKQTQQLERAAAVNAANLQEQTVQREQVERQLQEINRLPKVEQRPKQPERVAMVVPPETEPLQVPSDHRLETSAWHSIEVDSKTGKPVEQPAFTYGHEYYKERAAENAPLIQQAVTAGGSAAIAGISGATVQSSDQATQANQPTYGVSSPIPNATTNQPISHGAHDNRGQNNAKVPVAPLWPWLVALAVIVIILFIML